MIAAVGRSYEIGKGNALPWHVPAEMKLFRHMTDGHVVVMGRKTAESLRKPLPNRINVVLTRSNAGVPTGFLLARDVDTVLRIAELSSTWIIGGEEIYRTFLPLVSNIYLSHMEVDVPDADVFFPYDEMIELGFSNTLTVRPRVDTDITPFRQSLYQRS